MELVELIKHPERMDRDTLYELRSLLALYPYFQTVRLLLLKNLYLLHDPLFNEELRRAAIYITDRRIIFQMIEAGHYQIKALKKEERKALSRDEQDSRTLSLIDDFLESLPKEEEEPAAKKSRRKPTQADATVDYVAYLLENEFENEPQEAPQLKGQNLIDSFIKQDKGKLVLNENPTLKPEIESASATGDKETDQSYFTETLARIYIKQGNFSKALEIIQQLSLQNPKKNAYFADQIRFLKKLTINNNNKNLQK